MEKKDKSSPLPTSSLFDPAALLGMGLLGASPFGPGDSLLSPGGLPASLSSSLSPSSSNYGLFSMPNHSSSSTTTSSPSLSKSSPSATTLPSYSMSGSTSSRTTIAGRTSPPSLFTSPTRGRGSRRGGGMGRGRRGTGRGRSRGGRGGHSIPLSLVQSTSLLSPSMLEQFARKHLEERERNNKDVKSPERLAMSSLFDINFETKTNTSSLHRSPKSSPTRKSPSKTVSSNSDLNHDNDLDRGDLASTSQGHVHIDSLKKKLLADQILQKMHIKPAMSLFMPHDGDNRKRRGRPPKISSDDDCHLTPEELEEEAKIQARIKRELELELKQKEIALKMITKIAAEQDGLREKKDKIRGQGSRSKSPTKSPEKAKANGKLEVDELDSDSKILEPKSSDADDKTEPSGSKIKDVVMDTNSNFSSNLDSNDQDDTGSGSDSNMSDDSDNETGDDDGGKRKREQGDLDSERPIKRRHVVLDDSKIRIPLGKGWKRQTNIHSYGRRGIVGEVWYFAPCGRKMKTIPDVMRYIERNGITDLGRGHFSFNTKVNVGEFYEARVGGGENVRERVGFVKLTETEILDRLSVTVNRRMKKIENQKKREKLRLQQVMAKQIMENKMKEKLEQQEMARKVAEMQFAKRVQREQHKELMKRAKHLKILEKRKQREMERQQREEQMRMKQEMRAHQLMEEREMKRQQVAMLKEQMRIRQEQERRRQHMILLKALEQRKKQEEREKQKEEKMAERRLHRERKEEQRKMEFVLARELKKPREDMELRDFQAMPEYPRIPGNCVDGAAMADCLMSLEFMHNFAKPLGFDSDSLPTLRSLQDAVCCKTEEDAEEFLSLVTHLLRYALDDPGVPNPKEAVTKLGQKITDIEVTDVILAEVLRVFMVARNCGETELSEYLRNYPLEACSVSQRAAVIAFLCNELNCSKMITMEIESHLETMADIRRDKWVIEGKLRRLRVLRSKKFKPAAKPGGGEGEVGGEDSVMTSISKQSDEEEEKDESGNEEEPFNEAENAEDDPTTLEECQKQIEKLQKQHLQHREKVFTESQHVRATDLGQDRYKRNYWILPHVGGVFVEGMESGEIKGIVMPKSRSERSDSKLMKIEVIGEKTEKKGIALLEDFAERKAFEIKMEVEDMKAEIVKEMPVEEKHINGVIKFKKNFIKSEEKTTVKLEMGKDSENLQKAIVKDEIKTTDIPQEMKPLCNGDLPKSSNKLLNDLTQPHCNSGTDEQVKSPTKHVELKIPSIKSSAIEETERTSVVANVTSSDLLSSCAKTSKLSEYRVSSGNSSINCDASTALKFISSLSDMSSSYSSSPAFTSSLFTNTSLSDHVTKSTNHNSFLQSTPRPPPAHSHDTPPHRERKHSFMSIDSILDKTPVSSHSDMLSQHGALPVNPFETMSHKSVDDSEKSEMGPWFSLLPRLPCDDMSLTRGQHSSGLLLSPFLSQLPFHPFSCSPTYSSFQMSPLMTTTAAISKTLSCVSLSSVTQSASDTSFKKPEPVSSSQNSNPNPADVLKAYQGEAQPIPEEFKRGWWKVIDPQQVHDLQKCLHPRGIRERELQKTIQKYHQYTLASCSVGTDDVYCMESTSEEEVTDDEEDNSDNSEKANDSEVPSKPAGDIAEAEKNKQSGKQDKENLVDKPRSGDNDNLVNGCDHDTDDSKMDLGETDGANSSNDNKDESKQKEDKEKCDRNNDSDEKSDNKTKGKNKKMKGNKKTKLVKKMKKVKKPPPTIDCKTRSDEADRMVLDEVESFEDRIATASLQIKGWKLSPKTRSEESEIRVVPRGSVKRDENDCYPLEAAKERLLQLELNIERRYLKPPLSKARHRLSLNSISSQSQTTQSTPPSQTPPHQQQMTADQSNEDADSEVDFENLPIGLQMWRIAVATATSPAQLMLCVVQLNQCIAWEKSIMKVLCQICRKDDNEAELLLCDGCDRGYHTYCFKPKLESIPDGDWYCYECVAKAVGESCCLVCGRRLGKMAECMQCNRCVHIECLEPPLPRVPRKWHCATCSDTVKGSGKKRPRKNSTASTVSTSTPSNPAPAPVVIPATQSPPPPPAATPTADLTPTGRKRRCDFGMPRKRKSSESMDTDSFRKQLDDSISSVDDSSVMAFGDKSEKLSDSERYKLQEQSGDMRVCKLILTEMMKHEDGWPFLQPVNCKHFPSYRKYIKCPMDFGTMKVKLRDHVYQKRIEFVNDSILVFDNCQLFNEDDSEVGQCGHNMRAFFMRRWKELLFEGMTERV
ncbi:hypothetical protein DPMN_078153 [Dreissena polymorpha]|uniref:Bromodomain adjacent to zinc finger domain protein 2B n=1 Tax=Dreissena polymorpha TaxID=45954 RepID=A0A9D3YLP9_DREPO|nr:hypothetical protein DPMN_078153 [Dreissena polymorpha]